MAEASTSSSDQTYSQVPKSEGLKSQNGDRPVFPIMYPVLVPGLLPPHQHQEQINRGPGLYAVPVLPYMQPFGGFPPNTLIPFTYNLPTERSSPEAREVSGEQGQQGEQLQQQQQAGPQRQVVVRRFQIAIQLDILLILKLAAVIFLFNQDGSRQRLTLLVFFATLVYLYQTGALAPVIQWLSQGMRRAAAPPARPAARADNLAAAGEQGNENAGLAGENENENDRANDGNRGVENEHGGEGGQAEGGNRLWVIVKEIQMIVFGFITSLLPGFHNVD
ncbi:uncharacterized protein LOC131021326 isoform X2 [Salvia miltiorrhiza]|uniref:uncharacterized protein LOC131021326 isoform X2 n=1 Tax=Salvia miltiorrhiza TaxID=226208 RepID=UPI0025ABD3F7|nr:uncharacterized protein LOC131021326 isoform X2 [Salvia miltiorrhiza]